MSKVEEVLLQKILFIGDDIPQGIATDTRPKFIVLGTPGEFVNDIKEKENQDRPERPKLDPPVSLGV